MKLPLYQVDAFASQAFAGNPAAVVVSDAPLDPEMMLQIAAENNLSETAFVVHRRGDEYDLRWFTPTLEVDLCGHATLGAAFALMYRGDITGKVVFHTASGELAVRADGGELLMDFPAVPPSERCEDAEIEAALGTSAEFWTIRAVHGRRYLLALVADEAAVRDITPDIAALRTLQTNVIVTARGESVDVVSRFFAPASGVDEDPATGSAHCTLAPFWSERLDKATLNCKQLSRRVGTVRTTLRGSRVELAGRAVLYLEGKIHV